MKKTLKQFNKELKRLVLTFLMLSLTCICLAQFAGGEGTEASPWQVATAEHLNNVRNYLGEEHNDKFFIQTANINLGVPPWNANEGWLPIGGTDATFRGNYNGNNFTVNNLFINRPELNNVGLFGYCREASIDNLTLENVNVTGNRWVGGLVGDFSASEANRGSIFKCSASGNVTGLDRVGGLIGFSNYGTVDSCFAAVNATGEATLRATVGGLIGFASTGTVVRNSYAVGTASTTDDEGRSQVGGLVGLLNSGTVINCYATGAVTAYSHAGGLIGEADNSSTIRESHSTGTVTGTRYLGGLVGYQYGGTLIEYCHSSGNVDIETRDGGGLVGGSFSISVIRNSYSTGNVRGGSSHLGGLVGNSSSTISNSYSTGNVDATMYIIGGLIGYNQGPVNACYSLGDVSAPGDWVGGLIGVNIGGGNVTNCYSRGNVDGNRAVGGLIGLNAGTGRAANCYSTGRVLGNQFAGGLVGERTAGSISLSYWDMDTSGTQTSDAGEGRTTRQMIYPEYLNQGITYSDWDFHSGQAWVHDITREVNNGYPYLFYQTVEASDNPRAAINPQPEHGNMNTSVDLEIVRWSYISHPLYADPVGFRVYMNTNGVFGDNDPFVWVAYQDGRENYVTAEVLPEQLAYRTTYYWKVVPTTINPDRNGRERRAGSEGQRVEKEEFRDESLGLRESGIRRCQTVKGTDRTVSCPYRGDAENVPVWRFTTEVNPNPTVARNPNPADDAEDIDVTLANLGWTYTINQSHANPVGFRVYLNTTGEFGEEDEFGWVAFAQHQTNYHISTILPEQLNYATTYYWKVVPTTNQPNRNDERRSLRNSASSPRYGQNSVLSLYRGDAENVRVWSFTTLLRSPNPANAANPRPEHLAVGISLNMDRVTWDYISTETHTDPVGFRVYMNTTGAFGYNAPYVWIDFEEGVETYYSTDIVPTLLDANTSYFWRVIPTTIHPDEQIQQESCPYGQNSVLSLHTTEPALSKADDLNCTDRTTRHLSAQTGRRTPSNEGQSVSDNARGDALNCPVWRFTTGSTDVEDLGTEHIITALHGNYPNPFNPETTISFTLAKAGNVCITVYNISGQLIATLINDNLRAGEHSIVWKGRDNYNREAGSGIYFYRMKNGSYSSTNKMILLK